MDSRLLSRTLSALLIAALFCCGYAQTVRRSRTASRESSPGLSFRLEIDRPVYTANLMPPVDPERAVPVLKARLTVANRTELPLKLRFRSGQRFDIVIRDEAGREVLRWSDGRAFIQSIAEMELSPGEKTFSAEIPLEGEQEGRPLPEGEYAAEAYLTTADESRFQARIGFEIGHVF